MAEQVVLFLVYFPCTTSASPLAVTSSGQFYMRCAFALIGLFVPDLVWSRVLMPAPASEFWFVGIYVFDLIGLLLLHICQRVGVCKLVESDHGRI